MKGGGQNLKPAVWITARELPFRAVTSSQTRPGKNKEKQS
jgi:hypothetical protein